MVLNNDVKMINQLLPFCIYIYGPGYDERYLVVAIIKIKYAPNRALGTKMAPPRVHQEHGQFLIDSYR